MPRSTVEVLIGKCMLDDNFRAKFLADPKQAAHNAGFHLTDDESDAIRAAKNELEQVGNELSKLLQGPGAASFVDIHIH